MSVHVQDFDQVELSQSFWFELNFIFFGLDVTITCKQIKATSYLGGANDQSPLP